MMTLWIDGEKKDVWDEVSTLTITSTTQVLGVKCFNYWGGGYGIMGDVTDEAGKEILVTDDSWTCSKTAEEGWLRADFKGGDNWSPASYVTDNEYYMNNSDSWPWSSMSPNRHVIWTHTDDDTTVYCRIMMTISRIESGEFSSSRPSYPRPAGSLSVVDMKHRIYNSLPIGYGIFG